MVGKKCVVSQTALKFSKMERGEAKPFVYAWLRQKTGIGDRPTCTGEERTPKSLPYNCV